MLWDMAAGEPEDRAVDEEVARRIAGELAANPDVLGAIWVGSRERGEGIGPSSDLDIIAIIAETAGRKWRKGYVDEPSGRVVELLYRPASLDRVRFAQAFRSGESWPHGYAYGRVLFDKDGTLAGLIAEARELWERGPEALLDGDREWERYESWLQRADIADRVDGEPATANHLISLLGQRLFRFAYRLERRWYPPDKYLLRDLQEHDEELAALFVETFTGGEPRERLRALDAMFAALAHRYGIRFDAPYQTLM
jgi:hypothetical protein